MPSVECSASCCASTAAVVSRPAREASRWHRELVRRRWTYPGRRAGVPESPEGVTRRSLRGRHAGGRSTLLPDGLERQTRPAERLRPRRAEHLLGQELQQRPGGQALAVIGHPEGTENHSPARIALVRPRAMGSCGRNAGGQGFRIFLEIRYDRVYEPYGVLKPTTGAASRVRLAGAPVGRPGQREGADRRASVVGESVVRIRGDCEPGFSVIVDGMVAALAGSIGFFRYKRWL
jgi:hypothetical protein